MNGNSEIFHIPRHSWDIQIYVYDMQMITYGYDVRSLHIIWKSRNTKSCNVTLLKMCKAMCMCKNVYLFSN